MTQIPECWADDPVNADIILASVNADIIMIKGYAKVYPACKYCGYRQDITSNFHAKNCPKLEKCAECDCPAPCHEYLCSAAPRCACVDYQGGTHTADCPHTERCDYCDVKLFHEDHLPTCRRLTCRSD